MWKQSRRICRQKKADTCLEPKAKPRTQRPVPCKARWGRDIDELISLLRKIWFLQSYQDLHGLCLFPRLGCRAVGWGRGRCSAVHQDSRTQSPSNELHNEVSTHRNKKEPNTLVDLWSYSQYLMSEHAANIWHCVRGPCNSNGGSTTVQLEVCFIWILTFLHRIMRMMRKMTAMMTNTRTTAKTTTWDRRAEHR